MRSYWTAVLQFDSVYKRYFKRILDLMAALTGIVFFLPVMLLVAVVLAVANRGKVFFVQKRPGRGQKVINIIKFKTMNDRRGPDGRLLPDAVRLTRVGKFVRSTSLDELPQLINVFKGDMSLVGPRPLLLSYLPLYNAHQLRRHEVRPGITGWAQVNGRNTLDWNVRFKYDVWYVDNVSFLLDMKILVMTLYKVVKREGISSTTSVTMEPFKGNV